MLAKLLMIAMEDFAAIGMEDWSLCLRGGVGEFMVKYEPQPKDVRLPHSEVHR